MKRTHQDEIIAALEALGDFDTLDARRVQIDALMSDVLAAEATNPGQTYRMTVDGPEQTLADILADLGMGEAELRAIRQAPEGPARI